MLIIKTNIIKFRFGFYYTSREISIDKKRKLTACSVLEGKGVTVTMRSSVVASEKSFGDKGWDMKFNVLAYQCLK